MAERRIVRRGEHVLLGEMLVEDQKQFNQWRVDHPELLRLIRDFSEPTIANQMQWFQRCKEADRRMFSILMTASGELIGNGGLVDIDTHGRTAQLRMTIGNPAFWGKGYGTEATRLIIASGFDGLGLISIWLRVTHNNARARASYAKIGFREEGEEEFQGEKFLKMRVTREEFLA